MGKIFSFAIDFVTIFSLLYISLVPWQWFCVYFNFSSATRNSQFATRFIWPKCSLFPSRCPRALLCGYIYVRRYLKNRIIYGARVVTSSFSLFLRQIVGNFIKCAANILFPHLEGTQHRNLFPIWRLRELSTAKFPTWPNSTVNKWAEGGPGQARPGRGQVEHAATATFEHLVKL